jgi:hydrogenase-4 component B
MHISHMFDAIILLAIFFLSFWVFVVPKSLKYFFTLALLSGVIILSTIWCYKVFTGNFESLVIRLDLPAFRNIFILTIDRLSAFFILVVNLTVFTGLLYARGYLEPYYKTKNSLRFSIHYLSYLWLYFSMILVVMLRDGLSFLIMWEIMAVSSFLLVIFDADDRNVMKTGVNYLIQMHVGMFFILIAFLLVGKATGSMSFDSLGLYFSSHSNLLLFILFFTGFGIKAGFIPLHTWLPQAHPAAPSHVSGVMSGVMIKLGIYGIFRVLMSVQSDLFSIGIIILIVSLVSGVLGVMMAIVQHDLKRLLAYHSIENIGIIGIGTGLGVIGMATDNPALSILGFSGGLLHVLNHSLFKSLLFYNAGSVYQATHTRNIEHLGGLIKKMPYTAVFFLIGSLAICGLPPFNGFISEYLIFLGMFKSLSGANLYQSIVVMSSLVGLALIGGLAVFCFTKAFGIAFLGEPRSDNAAEATEVRKNMIYPQFIIIAFILLIGLASAYFVRPVFSLVSQAFGITDVIGIKASSIDNLTQISLIGGIFILATVALLVYRHFHLKTKKIETGPTWGCGYTAATSKHQYTATSYADNFINLANPILGTRKVMTGIKNEEIFPGKRKFETKSFDFFKKHLVDKPVNFLLELLKKIAVMQTGQIQHYILYLFIYMLILFLLSYLNLI